MGEKLCYVFGAGEYYDDLPVPAEGDLIIAADGGLAYLKARGISAHLVVGDFDSLTIALEGEPVMRLPEEKDDTDMLAALRVGLARGCRRFHIYGGTGGRFDHTMANIQCLAWLAEAGARGFLYGETQVMTMVKNGEISFPAKAAGVISVFAYTDRALGVTESGLTYSLTNATLEHSFPKGVSNAFRGTPSSISVEDGLLLVIYPKDVLPNG